MIAAEFHPDLLTAPAYDLSTLTKDEVGIIRGIGNQERAYGKYRWAHSSGTTRAARLSLAEKGLRETRSTPRGRITYERLTAKGLQALAAVRAHDRENSKAARAAMQETYARERIERRGPELHAKLQALVTAVRATRLAGLTKATEAAERLLLAIKRDDEEARKHADD